MTTIVTFGDSILDCGRYNDRGVHPGQLLVRNDDSLFPAWTGRDASGFGPAALEHRAVDGARVDDLPGQAQGLAVSGPAIALLTIGGNDLITGLLGDDGSRLPVFRRKLEAFLEALPIRPVLIGTVYDPTFGDDEVYNVGAPPALARANHRRMNEALAEIAARYGALADIHAHFLGGDPSWFTAVIEPSLRGACEVRACFWPLVEQAIRDLRGAARD
ncbi:MAG TPA: SGNH/GDSL hydrolase family protein [Herpetosiphonaceae bacterium]